MEHSFTNKKRIKHSLIVGIIAGAIFVAYIIASMIVNSVIASKYDKIHHFEDISVCSAFDQYVVDAKVSDKYIKYIEFVDSYVRKLNYEGREFTLYAYEFENADFSKQYWYNVKGQSIEQDIYYRSSTNTFGSELTVVYNNSAYRIKAGSTQEFIEVKKLINSVFTIEIR